MKDMTSHLMVLLYYCYINDLCVVSSVPYSHISLGDVTNIIA